MKKILTVLVLFIIMATPAFSANFESSYYNMEQQDAISSKVYDIISDKFDVQTLQGFNDIQNILEKIQDFYISGKYIGKNEDLLRIIENSLHNLIDYKVDQDTNSYWLEDKQEDGTVNIIEFNKESKNKITLLINLTPLDNCVHYWDSENQKVINDGYVFYSQNAIKITGNEMSYKALFMCVIENDLSTGRDSMLVTYPHFDSESIVVFDFDGEVKSLTQGSFLKGLERDGLLGINYIDGDGNFYKRGGFGDAGCSFQSLKKITKSGVLEVVYSTSTCE